jgi:hypothetical protein
MCAGSAEDSAALAASATAVLRAVAVGHADIAGATREAALGAAAARTAPAPCEQGADVWQSRTSGAVFDGGRRARHTLGENAPLLARGSRVFQAGERATWRVRIPADAGCENTLVGVAAPQDCEASTPSYNRMMLWDHHGAVLVGDVARQRRAGGAADVAPYAPGDVLSFALELAAGGGGGTLRMRVNDAHWLTVERLQAPLCAVAVLYNSSAAVELLPPAHSSDDDAAVPAVQLAVAVTLHLAGAALADGGAAKVPDLVAVAAALCTHVAALAQPPQRGSSGDAVAALLAYVAHPGAGLRPALHACVALAHAVAHGTTLAAAQLAATLAPQLCAVACAAQAASLAWSQLKQTAAADDHDALESLADLLSEAAHCITGCMGAAAAAAVAAAAAARTDAAAPQWLMLASSLAQGAAVPTEAELHDWTVVAAAADWPMLAPLRGRLASVLHPASDGPVCLAQLAAAAALATTGADDARVLALARDVRMQTVASAVRQAKAAADEDGAAAAGSAAEVLACLRVCRASALVAVMARHADTAVWSGEDVASAILRGFADMAAVFETCRAVRERAEAAATVLEALQPASWPEALLLQLWAAFAAGATGPGVRAVATCARGAAATAALAHVALSLHLASAEHRSAADVATAAFMIVCLSAGGDAACAAAEKLADGDTPARLARGTRASAELLAALLLHVSSAADNASFPGVMAALLDASIAEASSSTDCGAREAAFADAQPGGVTAALGAMVDAAPDAPLLCAVLASTDWQAALLALVPAAASGARIAEKRALLALQLLRHGGGGTAAQLLTMLVPLSPERMLLQEDHPAARAAFLQAQAASSADAGNSWDARQAPLMCAVSADGATVTTVRCGGMKGNTVVKARHGLSSGVHYWTVTLRVHQSPAAPGGRERSWWGDSVGVLAGGECVEGSQTPHAIIAGSPNGWAVRVGSSYARGYARRILPPSGSGDRPARSGDVIGVLLNLTDGYVAFFLNGEPLYCTTGTSRKERYRLPSPALRAPSVPVFAALEIGTLPPGCVYDVDFVAPMPEAMELRWKEAVAACRAEELCTLRVDQLFNAQCGTAGALRVRRAVSDLLLRCDSEDDCAAISSFCAHGLASQCEADTLPLLALVGGLCDARLSEDGACAAAGLLQAADGSVLLLVQAVARALGDGQLQAAPQATTRDLLHAVMRARLTKVACELCADARFAALLASSAALPALLRAAAHVSECSEAATSPAELSCTALALMLRAAAAGVPAAEVAAQATPQATGQLVQWGGLEGCLSACTLPCGLSRVVKSTLLDISADCLTVSFSADDNEEAGGAQADAAVPTDLPVYYFELRVLQAGSAGEMGVGFAAPSFDTACFPGWEARSYGYHGDDGHAHFDGSGSPITEAAGPQTYTTGARCVCGRAPARLR